MGDRRSSVSDHKESIKENPPNETSDNAENQDSTKSKGLEEVNSNDVSDASRCFLKANEDGSVLEPYPYGTDGKMMFENMRAKMKELPRFTIDFMGEGWALR